MLGITEELDDGLYSFYFQNLGNFSVFNPIISCDNVINCITIMGGI